MPLLEWQLHQLMYNYNAHRGWPHFASLSVLPWRIRQLWRRYRWRRL